MPYFFNGRLYITPGSMSKVNNTALLPAGPDVGNNLALVGHSTGGQPQVELKFGSPADAIATLNSGDLVDAIIRAFNPCDDEEVGAPATISVVRVDPATQSTLALRDGAASVVINLSSTNYGLRENQLKLKIEAATGGRGQKITTQRGTAYFVGDNIYRNAFSIQYGAGAASAVMTVNQTTVTLQAPSGTTVATIDLNVYPTIQQLVDRINTTAGFTAAVLDGNGAKPALNGLDNVTAQDVKTASYSAAADLQAIVDWFNTSGEPYMTAARAASVGTLPALIPFTYLSGAVDGAATNTDWSNAINVLQTTDIQWVTPLSNDPAIHAMIDAHVQFMSTTGRRERRSAVGTPLATTDAAAMALGKALNSNRTSMIHLGAWDYDLTGVLSGLVLYQPFIAAAMYAAGFCGITPGTPMTGKNLNVAGLERKLRNPTDTDALLQAGIVPLEDTGTGYEVVQSITTWLTDQNFASREQSVGVAEDYAARYIRQRVETACKGKKNGPQRLTTALSEFETCCIELAKPEEQGGPAVLVGDANNPAYKNLSAVLVGDAIALSGQLSIVLPCNYQAVTINAVPYSGSATIAA